MTGPRLRVDILTIFPGIFEGPLRESLLGKAISAGLVSVRVHDIRDHADPPHRNVDDYGFGGGPGMVMKPEPIFRAVEALDPGPKRVLVLSPGGRPLTQPLVRALLDVRLAGEAAGLLGGGLEGVQPAGPDRHEVPRRG